MAHPLILKSKILLILLIVFWVGACSTSDKTVKTPEERFRLAEYYEENDRYEEALRRFNEIRQEFPYSSWAIEAELKVADVYYKQEAYPEAAAAYERFRDQHPNHKKLDYVYFQIAMSYYQQVPETIDRDLSIAPRAIEAFEELLARFPQSSYAVESKSKQEELYQKLENKTKYIADFYFKIGAHLSSLGRYLELRDQARSPENRRWALLRGIECAKKLGDVSRQKELQEQWEREFGNRGE